MDMYRFTFLLVLFIIPVSSIREYTKEDILKLREEVREMFTFAYDSYLRHAYPADELRPLSCDGVDTWGSYSLTLVDALDTLAVMGNYTEFNRVVELVLKRKKYDADINVSVFETNIRIIGGLLSAHLLSYKTGMKLEPGWPCNGPLLRLAEDVAQRLIVAFDTNTGMPYGTVNLRSGVPLGETSITCTAGVGTFIIEFGTLSRLTGDPLYEEVAYNALLALYNHRSTIGLLGNHIDVMTGRWTAQDAGIGGGVDSYFEYLVKGAILLERPELMAMFQEARQVLDKYLRKEDWYVWATMFKGQVTLPVFQSLDAYWPGVLSLTGDSDTALRILHNYHSVWRQYGFTPEVYSLASGEAAASRESYPLRPELIESIMYLYRDTRDPILLQMGEDILRSIQHSARTHCGYATIKDVRDHQKEDRMESFFLAETTKYLYLLFDPDNFIHNPGTKGTVINTPNGECIVDVGGYVFNTEAHPVDPAMLHCCHQARNGLNLTEVQHMYKILEDEDNIKYNMHLKEADNGTKTQQNISASPKEDNITILNKTDDKESNTDTITSEELKPEIKTETRAGYVNIDGSEREKLKNWNDLSSTLTENNVENDEDGKKSLQDNSTTPIINPVEVEDIVVPGNNPETNQLRTPPKSNKAKEVFKMLPVVLQEFLSNSPADKPKCEPQHMLERIRKEKKYPSPPHTDRFELLLTPARSFMQRISLAGEFLDVNMLEV